jgi:high-affinity iron transporter
VLLNSVVIVLREALEAALMISILLALSRILDIRVRWVAVALVLGLLSAALYGASLSAISDLFDGVGQEVANATLQFLVFASLVYCLYLLSRNQQPASATLPVVMALAVMLAIAREGSEILVFVSGFLHSEDFFASVAIGSTIGAIIGISVGVLFYYLLLALPPGRALPTAVILLALVGAGGPLWDTSSWLSEQSTIGQLLYALVGYEATPTAVEVIAHASSLITMGLIFVAGRYLVRTRTGEQT